MASDSIQKQLCGIDNDLKIFCIFFRLLIVAYLRKLAYAAEGYKHLVGKAVLNQVESVVFLNKFLVFNGVGHIFKLEYDALGLVKDQVPHTDHPVRLCVLQSQNHLAVE